MKGTFIMMSPPYILITSDVYGTSYETDDLCDVLARQVSGFVKDGITRFIIYTDCPNFRYKKSWNNYCILQTLLEIKRTTFPQINCIVLFNKSKTKTSSKEFRTVYIKNSDEQKNKLVQGAEYLLCIYELSRMKMTKFIKLAHKFNIPIRNIYFEIHNRQTSFHLHPYANEYNKTKRLICKFLTHSYSDIENIIMRQNCAILQLEKLIQTILTINKQQTAEDKTND